AVLPGLKARVSQVKLEQYEKMDLCKQMLPTLPGETVWIQDMARGSKWEAVYEGPFTVLTQHKRGTYSLLDAMGELLPRKVPISQIKTIGTGAQKIDTRVSGGGGDGESSINLENPNRMKKTKTNSRKRSQRPNRGENDHYEIARVIDHRKRNGILDYLVEWKGYGPEDNSWVPIEDFDGLATIQRYWKAKGTPDGRKKKGIKNLRRSKRIGAEPVQRSDKGQHFN
ncbi:MAG: hypothetical protein ACRDFB_08530, partial [Rhabdochlamydiaceae bacterium]